MRLFLISNFTLITTTYLGERDNNGGGLMFYVNQDLNCILQISAPIVFTQVIKIPSLELNLKKQNWITIGLYKTPSLKQVFISEINNALAFYISSSDNILLMGNFNMMPENQRLQQIFDWYHLKNLVNESACFKSKTPTTIDLFATNARDLLIHCSTCETRIFDYRKKIYTFRRKCLRKEKVKSLIIDVLKTSVSMV